jgi:hypothetical protein
LLLQPGKVLAIVPLPVIADEQLAEAAPVIPRLHGWVRWALVAVALVLVGVFSIALMLNPYKDGKVWRQGTHQQLGLPPCRFYELTGKPCPSCGMSTSFALLVRGDVINSLRANAVGTLLALTCLLYLPWAALCAVRGRLYLIRSIEGTLTRLVVIFLVLMLLRWGLVLALGGW